MKIKNKKIYILILIVCILFSFIGLKIYKKPIKIEKKYENVLLIENGKSEKTTDIYINGIMYKRNFLLDIFKFEKILEGEITIDDKNYYVFATNQGKYTDNITWGDIRDNLITSNSKYVIYLTEDMNKLYIRNIDNEDTEFIYPVDSKYDYDKIKKIMYGE